MNARVLATFFAMVFAALLAACGGSSAPSPVATFLPGSCASILPPQLLYPAPGMVAVPDGNFQLYVNGPVNVFASPVLVPGSGTPVTGSYWSSPSPGPMPTGAATPSGPGAESVSQIPGLSAATAYTVNVTNSACSQTFSIGSFTTQ